MNKLFAFLVLGVSSSLLIGAPQAFGVVIDNDKLSTDLGYYALDMSNGGEVSLGFITGDGFPVDGILDTNIQIIFDYFTYVDVGAGGFQLSGTTITTPIALTLNDDEVSSSGTFIGSGGNIIAWTAVTSIADNSNTAVTVYTFTALTGQLGPMDLYQYLDEDVIGPDDCVFFTVGSTAGQNLELFTVDNFKAIGISHSGAFSPGGGLVNSGFVGWAVNTYDLINPAITSGTQNVDPNGIIANLVSGPHPNIAGLVLSEFFDPVTGFALGSDIVSVMKWSVVDPTATTATIITTLGGVPTVPVCGDGVINQGSEQCDSLNPPLPTATCDINCQTLVPPFCGDGLVNAPGEQCDSLNPPLPTATCDINCQTLVPPFCGDGIVNAPGEQCDSLNPPLPTLSCSLTCQTIVQIGFCGDGIVNQPNEECDDGNQDNGDACSNACLITSGGTVGFNLNLLATCGGTAVSSNPQIIDQNPSVNKEITPLTQTTITSTGTGTAHVQANSEGYRNVGDIERMPASALHFGPSGALDYDMMTAMATAPNLVTFIQSHLPGASVIVWFLTLVDYNNSVIDPVTLLPQLEPVNAVVTMQFTCPVDLCTPQNAIVNNGVCEVCQVGTADPNTNTCI